MGNCRKINWHQSWKKNSRRKRSVLKQVERELKEISRIENEKFNSREAKKNVHNNRNDDFTANPTIYLIFLYFKSMGKQKRKTINSNRIEKQMNRNGEKTSNTTGRNCKEKLEWWGVHLQPLLICAHYSLDNWEENGLLLFPQLNQYLWCTSLFFELKHIPNI